ncbi:MAG TPA: HAMP domain-containing sensor histidine kinase [Steroidobacteraceae bacterium]|nr:HAMP domain-containing sensor histidine kinase [Steroidobacteraceae bacterium]
MKINPLRTSAFRLALGYGVIFTFGVSALLVSIYLLTKTVLNNEIDAVIAAELEGLTDEYNRFGLNGLADELTWRTDSWGRTGAVYLLVDSHLAKVGGNLLGWPFAGIPRGRWSEFYLDARGTNDEQVRHPVRASVSLLPDGHRLLVGMDVNQERGFVSTFRTATLWGIGLTALVGVLAGSWLSRGLTRRVQSVAETCDAIVGGDLSRRMLVTGARDEFDALAQAVNFMVDRLAEKTQLLRATFDSAAHDLRAPLYRLRGRLEDTLRDPNADQSVRERIDASLQELDHVQRTLSTLLEIAQAESAISVAHSTPVDLGELASDMAELYEPAARQRQLQLTVRKDTRCEVRGNRQLLAQLLANLVENSLKYVPAGGHIDVEVEQAGAGSRLIVADSGPGIPESERSHVLQPFVRLPSAAASTAGTGLGLSLVAAIARLHHAQLALEDNAPGLRVVLSFGSV